MFYILVFIRGKVEVLWYYNTSNEASFPKIEASFPKIAASFPKIAASFLESADFILGYI